MMRRILFLISAGLLLCSCSSTYQFSQKDALTPAEEEQIVAFVRRFILHSKINLTPAERAVVRNTKPDVRVTYTGYKQGNLAVRWQIKGRLLRVSNSGDLLSNRRSDWEVRIVTDPTVGKLPDYFYGAHGEDLSLPPL